MGFPYLEKYCAFTKLTPHILKKCGDFVCENDNEIDEFFHSEFPRFADNHYCKSFCFIHKEDKKLVAAFTLSATSISVKNNRKLNAEAFEANIVGDKLSQYPAVLLGQLAVFKGYNGNRLGYEVVDFVKTILSDPDPVESNNLRFCNIGFKFIIVDAKNVDYVIRMYKDSGFEFAFSKIDEQAKSQKMFFDISTLR